MTFKVGHKSGMFGKKHSKETIAKMSAIKIGKNNPMWNDGQLSYSGIHLWLRRTFGTPKACEHCGDTRRNAYDWAKIFGKDYERKRCNFLRLCRNCHLKYEYSTGERVGRN